MPLQGFLDILDECACFALSDEWSALADAIHSVQPIRSKCWKRAERPHLLINPVSSYEEVGSARRSIDHMKTHLIQKETQNKDGFATNWAELLQIV